MTRHPCLRPSASTGRSPRPSPSSRCGTFSAPPPRNRPPPSRNKPGPQPHKKPRPPGRGFLLSKVPYATRRDGWEVARTTTKGDVVFIDPTYLGVQAYGGSKDNVTSRDANDVKEAIQKLADLAKTTIENGFSIVYTNEFSDKSKAKKGGLSQEQYADIWNEAMRQIWQEVGQENASIAYVDRGKKDAADVLIVIGKARDVLEQAIKMSEGTRKRERKTRTEQSLLTPLLSQIRPRKSTTKSTRRRRARDRRTRTASTPTCPGTSHAPPSVDGDRRNIGHHRQVPTQPTKSPLLATQRVHRCTNPSLPLP